MLEKKSRKILLLLDGNAILHRAYHALPPLMTKNGVLVNAVYGFSATLLSVLKEFKPDYIAASFDVKAPTFRHHAYKDYKATRKKAPDDLYAQIPLIKEVVTAFNIPIYECPGFEADDVIGTLAKIAEKEELDVIIVTGDMDTLQLVTKQTRVFAMRRGMSDTVLFDKEKVKEKYGLTPNQIPDFKGLRGDPSDNIPGVTGIGEKSACTLLQEFTSLEEIYRNLDKIKPALKTKLERDREQARLSKVLGTIKIDVPLIFKIEDCKTLDFQRGTVTNLFKDLNFFSLLKRIPDNTDIAETDTLSKSRNDKNTLVKDFKYELITEEKYDTFLKKIRTYSEIAFTINHENMVIKGIAFSYKTGRASYISYTKKTHSLIKEIIENPHIKKIGYDLKQALHIFHKNSLDLKNIFFDVRVAAYSINPGGTIDLENIVLSELGDELEIPEKNNQPTLLDLKSEQEYAEKFCRHVDYIYKLYVLYDEKIKAIATTQTSSHNIQKLFSHVQMPLIETLAHVEETGIKFNPVIFKDISDIISKKIKSLENTIYKHAGCQFNINSPKQLRVILFETLKLSTDFIKKTKTGLSTASNELGKLHDLHPIIKKIEEYRELFKLKSTYLDTLPHYADSNSRIHTHLNATKTTTGRLASMDPNLQNIPIRTDLGKLLRTAFVAEDGYIFISADYSQIDLRCIAHISNDKKMIEAFHKGEDIHTITAMEINQVSKSEVTKEMRRNAKALNFGIIYGIGAFGLAQSAKITQEEARLFISKYLEKFAGIALYMKKTKEEAKKTGFVETPLGRRRYVPELNSPNIQIMRSGERMAINMPVQGFTADIMNMAINNVYQKIVCTEENKKTDDVRLVLQIHDEIILEVREALVTKITKDVKTIMEKTILLKVPVIVEVKTGRNWGEI